LLGGREVAGAAQVDGRGVELGFGHGRGTGRTGGGRGTNRLFAVGGLRDAHVLVDYLRHRDAVACNHSLSAHELALAGLVRLF